MLQGTRGAPAAEDAERVRPGRCFWRGLGIPVSTFYDEDEVIAHCSAVNIRLRLARCGAVNEYLQEWVADHAVRFCAKPKRGSSGGMLDS